MMKLKSKEFIVALAKRALYTFAEVALSMLTIGQAFIDVDWLHVLSVSGVAAIISIFKGILIGLPEVSDE